MSLEEMKEQLKKKKAEIATQLEEIRELERRIGLEEMRLHNQRVLEKSEFLAKHRGRL